MTKLIQIKETISKSFAVVFGYEENWHWVLSEDGTHEPKYVGEAHLMFILRKCNLLGY